MCARVCFGVPSTSICVSRSIIRAVLILGRYLFVLMVEIVRVIVILQGRGPRYILATRRVRAVQYTYGGATSCPLHDHRQRQWTISRISITTAPTQRDFLHASD